MELTPEETKAWFDEQLLILGMTQRDFANSIGISPADFSRYRSRKQEARIQVMRKIAEVFGMNIIEVMIGMGHLDPEHATTPKVDTSKRVVVVRKAKK